MVNKNTVATLGRAQNFGESALLRYGTRRKATVKAISFLWLSLLSRFDFEDICDMFPGDGKVMLFNARKKLENLEDSNAEARQSMRKALGRGEFSRSAGVCEEVHRNSMMNSKLFRFPKTNHKLRTLEPTRRPRDSTSTEMGSWIGQRVQQRRG